MGRNWAITIGIDEYDNLQSLSYAKRDALAMRDYFLNEMGFEVVYHFADDAPDIELPYGPPLKPLPIYTRLDRFLDIRFKQKFLKSGDNFWFFFAGHGKRDHGSDYLMPSDVNPANTEGTAIRINYVVEKLRYSGADNVIVLLDACRNEGERDGEGIGIEIQQGVVILFACSPGERSQEIDQLQQGAFTHTLLKGLRVQGEGNCATVERLHQYLRYRVPELNQHYGKPRQTPYIVAEPISKQHLILLPKFANLDDVNNLRNDAMAAEIEQNWELAEQLWMRVLDLSGRDEQALRAIKRLPKMDSIPTGISQPVKSATLASKLLTVLIPIVVVLAVISAISVVASYNLVKSEAWNNRFNETKIGPIIDFCRVCVLLATALVIEGIIFSEEAVLYINSKAFVIQRRLTFVIGFLVLLVVLAQHLYIGPNELCETYNLGKDKYFGECLLPYMAFLPYSIISYIGIGVPLGSLYIHVILEDCRELRNKRQIHNDFIKLLMKNPNLTQEQIERHSHEIESKKLPAMYRQFCNKVKRHVNLVAVMVLIVSCDILFGKSTMSSSGFVWSQLFYIFWFLTPISITVLFIFSEYQKIVQTTLNFFLEHGISSANLDNYGDYNLFYKTILSNIFLHGIWIILFILYFAFYRK
jgi:uncharacterized caspase-like protein